MYDMHTEAGRTAAVFALLTEAAEMGRTDGDRDARYAEAYGSPALSDAEVTALPRGREPRAFADYLMAGRNQTPHCPRCADGWSYVSGQLATYAGGWYAQGYAELVEAHADATVTVPTGR